MSELEFHYILSSDHKEIKVDGAIGGPSPTGDSIAISVYSERSPIPRTVVHQMTDHSGGRSELGDEIKDRREGKDGIIRAVQCTLHMRISEAKSLHKWLGDHIDSIDSLGGTEK